jgi:membrane associated rhomboid family serine protease
MTPWTTRLILANVLVFFITLASPQAANMLAFVPAYILIRPWTIITYMFVHGGFLHILFNMLALYFFGPRLELTLGNGKFLGLYFISGITGGLFSFLFAPYTAIIGASAAVFGVMYAFAHYWPTDRLLVWGFPMQARTFVIVLTALSLFAGFGGFVPGIAHFAHLGGFVGGFVFMKIVEGTSRAARFKRKMAQPEPEEADIERWMNISREGMHEVNREQLDRVQAKIKLSGVRSLTPDEVAFLNRFSER